MKESQLKSSSLCQTQPSQFRTRNVYIRIRRQQVRDVNLLIDVVGEPIQPAVTESVPADNEVPTRRSVHQNKGVPAHRLSYMVHVQYPKEPASWKEVEE